MNTEKAEKSIFIKIVIIMMAASAIMMVNTVLNFTVRSRPTMGYISLLSSAAILLSCLDLIINKKKQRAFLISLIFVTLNILAFYIDGNMREVALAWILVLPLIAHYTQGLKKGLVFTYILIPGSISCVLIRNFLTAHTIFKTGTYIEVLVIYSIVAYMTFTYERAAQQKEKLIHTQYYYDSLTSLPNRKKLIQDISLYEQKTLVLVNIDDFKEINNIIGITGGDIVLKEMAQRLTSLNPDNESTLYKLHADEFAFLIPGEQSKEEMKLLAEKIQTIMDMDIEIKGTAMIASISIGISNYSERLFSTADIALRTARLRKQPFTIYSNELEMTKKYEENIHQLYQIQKGILNDRFLPYFQPIYDIHRNKIQKFECLIRLDEEGTIIEPKHFLDISKRSRKYPWLTRIMVTKSFQHFGPTDHDFSINLCLEDMINPETTSHIYSELESFDIGERVIFELLESERIESHPEVFDFIQRVREFGCKLAIDDFGSGYSNFEYILRMKFDFLKIDASLVKNVIQDDNARIMINTIVEFCKQLNIKTIAEYVSSKEIYEMIRDLGVDFAQGYFVGMPEENTERDYPIFTSARVL
ncbi:bifunctional diguanylate cyclase/phosphodiesterase [Oceanispirochaeta crateris]|uniref:Bifunctional diguanylate cyclase/phosphodiesterase n=1 Tax=Oceanispirochaeta crateris TaxID=2518645 RepID=A0A5C1QL43_9SPIO|nr:bifunctional diguanylate cyclase/phosphodiesterase [Oceanispirochaeta crateris]QEN08331.1 bifunctional diguanylate cyclase/phosphodiesterase [Oceanispirochaeta crateris]